MEAEDTVLSPELYPHNYLDMSQKDILKLQAVISFKAGYHQREIDPLDKEDRCEKCYEQGMKDVIGWIEKNKIVVPTLANIEINYHEWQFKKKEWGIKED